VNAEAASLLAGRTENRSQSLGNLILIASDGVKTGEYELLHGILTM
jgi:hypothetical protein